MNHQMMILVVGMLTLLLIPAPSNCEQYPVSLKGGEYIRYKISIEGNTRRDKVTLSFRTMQPNGILLYSCGENSGDFLLLELKRGKLVYTGDFGSTYGRSGVHSIISDREYNNNKWHDVSLVREMRTDDLMYELTYIALDIDGRVKNYTADLEFKQLNLDGYLYVGGMSNEAKTKQDDSCQRVADKKNFVGCLKLVRFNARNILYAAKERLDGYEIFGRVAFRCPTVDVDEIIGFNGSSSRMRVSRNILKRNRTSYEMVFRTFESQGHIMTHEAEGGRVEMVAEDGKINIKLKFLESKGIIPYYPFHSNVTINDGGWHHVKLIVIRSENKVVVVVDDEKAVYSLNTNIYDQMGVLMHYVDFGGSIKKPSFLPGLVSCFRLIEVDGKRLNLSSSDVVEKVEISSSCRIRDLCFPNPCHHGATCTQTHQAVQCQCKHPDYGGELCGTCIHKRNCEEIWQSGKRKSGQYKICPDNGRIFTVHCDMSLNHATVLSTSIRNDTMVKDGNLFLHSIKNIFHHQVHYEVQGQEIDLEDIKDLIDESTYCRQYLRFDCFKSYLLKNLNKAKNTHFLGARWLSRDSDIMNYWGGSNEEKRTCKCGMNDTCARGDGDAIRIPDKEDCYSECKNKSGQCDGWCGEGSFCCRRGYPGCTAELQQVAPEDLYACVNYQTAGGNGCNCDLADERWRYDDGYITDKDKLPITAIQFTEETYPQSFFSVGRLECFGYYPPPTTPTPSTPDPIVVLTPMGPVIHKHLQVFDGIPEQTVVNEGIGNDSYNYSKNDSYNYSKNDSYNYSRNDNDDYNSGIDGSDYNQNQIFNISGGPGDPAQSMREEESGGFWNSCMIVNVLLGSMLCILIVFMVVVLCFCREKCLGYGKYPRPRIEFADYNSDKRNVEEMPLKKGTNMAIGTN